MQNPPLVSIGIPTYNRANGFLRDALESALRQSYKNLEIIVSDNGSTDNTKAYVTSFNDPRIKYFCQSPSIAPHENFNFCLNQATGAYFSLLHDDDVLDDDFIETCMKAANYDDKYGLIRTGLRGIDDNGKLLFEKKNLARDLPPHEFFMAWFQAKTPMHLCSTLFNTKKLRTIGGFNSKHQLFNDVAAELRLVATYERKDVEEIKASFRRHVGSRTSTHKIRPWCEDSLELLDLICALAPEQQEKIRKEGIQFFTKHNLRLVRSMPSVFGQLISYWIIFWTFERPTNIFVNEMRFRLRHGKLRPEASVGA